MKSKQTKIAVVIGAGIAGIAAAIRLNAKGFKVICLEANSYPGGKLSEVRGNGYRFDAGPSLFTMPQYVEDLFKLQNKNSADYFQFKKLENTGIYFYADGTVFKAYSDTEKFHKELGEKLSIDRTAIEKFLTKSEEIYRITNSVFIESSIHSIKTYLKWSTFKSILGLPKIDAFKTMAQRNKIFFKSYKAQQYFNRYATYNGSDPYRAPATLNVIPHLEHHYGAYIPNGGMYSITKSLYKLALDVGVEFKFNCRVKEILYHQHKIKGVKFIQKDSEMELHADIVFSNMDMVHTYRKLLPNFPEPSKLLNQEKSSSALIFYWGIRKEFKELDLHNFFFTENYEKEFESISKGEIYSDPTVYVNITSKHVPSDATSGSENWFVMINVPHNNNQSWDELINIARGNILSKLSKMLKCDVESLIEFEEILDPRTIESKTSSFKGALYGNSSNKMFSAFLRHSNKSSEINGLYFVGGSVHPGGGIPLALQSAKIACDLI